MKMNENYNHLPNELESSENVELTPCASSNIEVGHNSKRKRIHLGAYACEEVGTSSLTEPKNLGINIHSHDVNRGLYPVVRHKRRKTTDMDNSSRSAAVPLAAEGFVSASKMYRIDLDSSEPKPAHATDTFSAIKASPTKQPKKIKQILNQGSILNFMAPKSSASATVTLGDLNKQSSSVPVSGDVKIKTEKRNEDDDISTLYNGRTVMLSPIKKLGSESACIYISDSSPCSSPASSQNSQISQQQQSVDNNVVVKKLFEAQKNVKSVKNKPPPKRKSVSKKSSPFVSKKEVSSIQNEVAKYFDNDSFDMKAAFNSDMEDFAESPKPASSLAKTVVKLENAKLENDKYGLLGSGSYPKDNAERINYFERLPPEVLENIFCQLPMLDLCLNSNRVCLQWNNIIADEKVELIFLS